MDQFGAAAGLAGALATSVAVYATVRRVQRAASLPPDRWAQTGEPDALVSAAEVAPPPRPVERPAVPVRARRVVPAGRARTPRPGAAPPTGLGEGPWELLSLIGSMQWDRALALIERQAAAGLDPPGIAALAEAAALERLRALPESEIRLGLGGYRVLAALAPGNAAYGEKVAQCLGRLEGRRQALLSALTRDEDRYEPGTVWFNHPYNALFDDVRRPIWPYVGCREGHAPRLRLRTNWLGGSRIRVHGLEVVHDGVTETLTRGAYKIDPDALGWEWRDEEADVYQVEVLRSLAGAGEVTLRYRGDPWSCEAPLAEEEKRGVAETIELYDLLRAAAPLPLPSPTA